jgi:hypothetical protein
MRRLLSSYWYWLRYNPRFFAVRMLCEVGIHDFDKERLEQENYGDPCSRQCRVVYCQKCCQRKVLENLGGTP